MDMRMSRGLNGGSQEICRPKYKVHEMILYSARIGNTSLGFIITTTFKPSIAVETYFMAGITQKPQKPTRHST